MSTPLLFGVASGALHVEGIASVGGRGPSVWDAFARVPGPIEDGSTPARAADHHGRWADDLDLLAGSGWVPTDSR
ncbi:MAG TPA: family 1 glycosylhydrolase [Nakamurella sp.]